MVRNIAVTVNKVFYVGLVPRFLMLWMAATGTEPTCGRPRSMSALGGRADIMVDKSTGSL